PAAAAPVDRGRAGLLIVVAEAVGVLPVALAGVRIVVVVRIAVEDQVAAARAVAVVGDGQARAGDVVYVEVLVEVVGGGAGAGAVVPDAVVRRTARHRDVHDLQALEVQPASRHVETGG